MSCRLIIVEGIMGSGKSLTTKWLTKILRHNNYRVHPVDESFWPHPTRVITDLKRPLSPWREMTAGELARRSREKWHKFIVDQADSGELAILDGQLFHGDMTSLMMMGMAFTDIEEYVRMIYSEIATLQPFLIYFHQTDTAAALERISANRDPQWLQQQLAWKLDSPYARQKQLTGLTGLIDFYKDYRNLTDAFYEGFKSGKCKIENQRQNWKVYHQMICEELRTQAKLHLNAIEEDMR